VETISGYAFVNSPTEKKHEVDVLKFSYWSIKFIKREQGKRANCVCRVIWLPAVLAAWVNCHAQICTLCAKLLLGQVASLGVVHLDCKKYSLHNAVLSYVVSFRYLWNTGQTKRNSSKPFANSFMTVCLHGITRLPLDGF
jgi:hypothetical protein